MNPKLMFYFYDKVTYGNQTIQDMTTLWWSCFAIFHNPCHFPIKWHFYHFPHFPWSSHVRHQQLTCRWLPHIQW